MSDLPLTAATASLLVNRRLKSMDKLDTLLWSLPKIYWKSKTATGSDDWLAYTVDKWKIIKVLNVEGIVSGEQFKGTVNLYMEHRTIEETNASMRLATGRGWACWSGVTYCRGRVLAHFYDTLDSGDTIYLKLLYQIADLPR